MDTVSSVTSLPYARQNSWFAVQYIFLVWWGLFPIFEDAVKTLSPFFLRRDGDGGIVGRVKKG